MLVAAFAMTCASANAQSPDADTPEDETIVVEAPRSLPPPPSRSSYSGAPIVTTTVKIQALYGDLDLTQPVGAARLMTRIERVAHDACQYLDRLFPLSPDADCIDRAIANARPSANAAIAAARK
jgi:UrcA family protein